MKTKQNEQSYKTEEEEQLHGLRTTERPPLVGEVIANVLRIEGATWSG
jgi:hypothetical protein